MWIAGGADPARWRAARIADGWVIAPGWDRHPLRRLNAGKLPSRSNRIRKNPPSLATLNEGDYCTVDVFNEHVGTKRFEVRSERGQRGDISVGTAVNLNGFRTDRNGEGTGQYTASPLHASREGPADPGDKLRIQAGEYNAAKIVQSWCQ